MKETYEQFKERLESASDVILEVKHIDQFHYTLVNNSALKHKSADDENAKEKITYWLHQLPFAHTSFVHFATIEEAAAMLFEQLGYDFLSLYHEREDERELFGEIALRLAKAS